MIGKTNAGGGGSFATANDAVLVVSAPAGSTVTISKGGVTKVAAGWQNNDGVNYYYYFAIKAAEFDSEVGWNVTATLGNSSAQTSVIITTNNVYSVMLAYHIPIQYQEVAYLESDGSQRLTTGLAAQDIRSGVIKGRILGGSNSYASLFGACNKTDTIENAQTLAYVPYSGSFYLDNNGSLNCRSINANTDFTVEFSYSTGTYGSLSVTVNGQTNSSSGSIGDITSYNVWLFSCSYKSNHIVGVTARISEAKFYNSSNELIGDFVPCYQLSTGYTGMYDTVSETFRHAVGGEFTLGPNV